MSKADDVPEWAWDIAIAIETGYEGGEGGRRPQFIARALVAAERRGIETVLPLALRLERAVTRAEEGAGTLPATQSVKLRPHEWHWVADLSCELASAIRQLGASE